MGKDNRDDTVYLGHILEATDKIQRYIGRMSFDDFCQNDLVYDALIRELQVVGEAVTNLSGEFREKYAMLPWSDAVGMRNRIVHGYFNIDKKVVWDTVQDDLPSFKKQIEEILR